MRTSYCIGWTAAVVCLLLAAALLTLPAEAAPAPEETPLSSPWFPETPQRRPQSQLRPTDERHGNLLGGQLLRPGHAPVWHPHQVSSGYLHTCACAPIGRAAHWPAGVITSTARLRPRPAPSPRSVQDAYHTCGLQTDGTMTCWGNECLRLGHPAGRHLQPGQRRRVAHLRAADRWHAGLLGVERLRPGHTAGRDLHPGQRRRLAQLRGPDRRHAGLLGVTTPTARPRRHPVPSPRSAQRYQHTCALRTP